MTYINPIDYGDISGNIVDPFDVTIDALKTSGTEIVSALRFEYPEVPLDAGVDVSDEIIILGQVVTVGSIWALGETPKAGVKRVQVIAHNSDDSAQDEVNIFFNVLY